MTGFLDGCDGLKAADASRYRTRPARARSKHLIKRIVLTEALWECAVKRLQEFAKLCECCAGIRQTRRGHALRQEVAPRPVCGDQLRQGEALRGPSFALSRIGAKSRAPDPQDIRAALIVESEVVIVESARERLKRRDLIEIPIRDECRQPLLKHDPSAPRMRADLGRDRAGADGQS